MSKASRKWKESFKQSCLNRQGTMFQNPYGYHKFGLKSYRFMRRLRQREYYKHQSLKKC